MPAPDAHVLVVDDDRDVRETVAAALETDGYHVRCAENGAQALAALLHERRPEAVILDLSMPVMTGWELIATVHEDRDLQKIPFVVVSAMRAPPGVEQLDKPVRLHDLLRTLDRLCRH